MSEVLVHMAPKVKQGRRHGAIVQVTRGHLEELEMTFGVVCASSKPVPGEQRA